MSINGEKYAVNKRIKAKTLMGVEHQSKSPNIYAKHFLCQAFIDMQACFVSCHLSVLPFISADKSIINGLLKSVKCLTKFIST
jgi:hypothetical protein